MKRGVLFFLVFAAALRGGLYAQQMNLEEAVKSAARSVEEVLTEGTMVAVLNFASPAERFSDYVIEELTGELVNGRKVAIVDRQNLALITSEMNLQLSGDVSDESAQTIGRLLGAESIISGTLAETGTYYRFRVRVISVETALIQTQIALDLRNDEQVAFLLTGDAQNAAPTPAPVAEQEADVAVPASTEVKSAGVRKNWISGGYGVPMGGRYERMLGSKTSLGLRVDLLGPMYTNQVASINYFAVVSVFRWYPAGKIFFMGIGAGYYLLFGNLVTGTERYGYNNERDITESYTTHAGGSSIEFGWKWDPGKAGGFFMELSLLGAIAIGKNPITETMEVGGTGGLIFGLGGSF